MSIFKKIISFLIPLLVITGFAIADENLGGTIYRLPAFTQSSVDTIEPRVANSNLDLGFGDFTAGGNTTLNTDWTGIMRIDSGVISTTTSSGVGDVVGPASSTDNAVVRFDLETGKLLQNSVVTISDAGLISGASNTNWDDAYSWGDWSGEGFITDLSGFDTGDLSEGTNLYYTSARFNTAFSGKSTTDLSEGTNLYYTEARVSANSSVSDNTAKVTESTTVTSPLVLTTYDISIPSASSTASGYLSSTDWSTFNSKQTSGTYLDDDDFASNGIMVRTNVGVYGLITDSHTNWDSAYTHIGESGASHTYIDQDVTTSSTPIFGIDNFTDGGGLVLITSTQETNFETAYTNRITSATSPLDITTNTISISQADTDTSGYLSDTDWDTFNNKQNTLTFGIADTNAVRIDGADIGSGEYGRFTVTGLESRTIGEIKTDLVLVKADVGLGNVDNVADASQTSVGALASGSITTGFTAIGDDFISSASTWNAKWDSLTDMVLTDTYIYVGNVSNDPVGVIMSNDCTLSNTGVITCDHDALNNFVANEHLDWTADLGATNIHAGNYTNTTYTGGTGITLTGTVFLTTDSEIVHDNLSGFLANEHLDWTASVGTIHADNYTDTNTQLSGENVDDFVYALLNDAQSVHTLITITYDDTDNAYDFVVDDDLSQYSNVTSAFITTSALTNYMQDEDINTFSELQSWVTDATLTKTATTTDTKYCTWNAGLSSIQCEAEDNTGYTNLTSFVNQTAWRAFYSNTDGDVTELALGADGTYLKSNGADQAPTWASPAGGGTVTNVFDCATGDCNTLTVGTSEYLTYGTGYIDANRFAGVTTVDATEFGYLNNVSSAIQTQLNAKAPLDSPTFTTAFTATGLIGDEDLQHEDFGDFTCAGEDACLIDADSIDADDIDTINAGRSTTWDATNDEIDADPETYVYKAKIAFEDPTATDDFFFGEIATAVTFTSIYCKTLVGTAEIDVSIGGADINGTDISCTTSGVLDDSLGGDTAGAVGEEVKLLIESVASSPTYIMVIVNGTYND